MTDRSSATAIAASNTVDSELILYFADSKAYAQNDEWRITLLDCKWAEVSTFVSSCTGSAVSASIWSIHGTCVFGLRGADSRQAKLSHQGLWEENIPENVQKILWIGLLSIGTDNDTGSYAQ